MKLTEKIHRLKEENCKKFSREIAVQINQQLDSILPEIIRMEKILERLDGVLFSTYLEENNIELLKEENE